MAMQVGESVAPLSPQTIGNAFAQQYYNVLHSSPGQVYKFYHDSSTLGRPDSNGGMISVTTMTAINDEFLSTDFSSCLIKLENVDAQSSLNGGVLILVTGSIEHNGTVRHIFSQSFFLAPQESGGYFVLNDMLRYDSLQERLLTEINDSPQERLLTEINDSLPNHVDINTHSVTFTSERETSDNVNKIAVLELPSSENVNDNVENLPANDSLIDSSPEENVVEACAEVVSQCAENIPVAAPAPRASAQKDVTKQSYASVVKVTKEGTPTPPVAKPKPKPKPKLTAKVTDNAEKSVSSPVKPTHAADTTSPTEKIVLVEQGYSVYVKNLPYECTGKEVEENFRKFGAIRPGGIQVRHQPDGFCFGFVEFESRQSMLAAIEASPISIRSKASIVEEKRTTTRVVNGVTHTENNGNARGGRFQQDNRGGGYRGDNFRGREAGFVNNGNYRDGDNMRNGFRNQRNQNEYSGHGRGPQGNGYHQNGGGYHQNCNGYHQNGDGYHQNGNRYNQNGNRYHQNGDDYYKNINGYRQNGAGYYHQNGNGYRQDRIFHNGNGNGRPARFNGPRQTPVQA